MCFLYFFILLPVLFTGFLQNATYFQLIPSDIFAALICYKANEMNYKANEASRSFELK